MSENKPVLIALVVTGLALVGLLVYYFTSESDSGDSVTETVVVAPPAVEPEPQPEPEPAPIPEPEPVPEAEVETPRFVLPRLDNSDQLIRDGAVSLTRHEGINGWLGSEELVRKAVAFVDNVAAGSVAREPAAALAPRGPIQVREIEEGVYVMDERSFDRYDRVTNVFLSLDTERSVEFYLLLKPLFAEAYGELGYPDGTFDQVILRAIGRLLETPDLTEPARLVRPVVMYEYQDPRLENLSAAQKQLLRMGPEHGAAVKNKLRDLARELRSAIE